MEYYSIDDIRKIEQEAIRKGMTEEKMIDTAGHLASDFIVKNLAFKKAVFIAGPGNNGGDTLSTAFHLFNLNHFDLEVFVVGKPDSLKEESDNFIHLLNDTKSVPVKFLSDPADLIKIKDSVSNADLLVVGIFGMGFHGELPPLVSDLIDLINNSQAKKISIDVPTGMNGDTGEFKKAVKSDFTLTMLAMKKAFENQTALSICGKISVLDLLD